MASTSNANNNKNDNRYKVRWEWEPLLSSSRRDSEPENLNYYHDQYTDRRSDQQESSSAGGGRHSLMNRYPRRAIAKWSKTLNNTCITFVLIALIVFCLLIAFKVWHVTSGPERRLESMKSPMISNLHVDAELLVVSIFLQTGDTAPKTRNLFGMDRLEGANLTEHIWPNGLGKLTDAGRFRMTKLGHELGRLYRYPLRAHESKKVLAFSADDDPSCLESLKLIIRSFFNFETSVDTGLDQLRAAPLCLNGAEREVCKMLPDSGLPDEWMRVSIDNSNNLPLKRDLLERKCSNQYNITRCKKWSNLKYDKRVKSLPGFDQLEKYLDNIERAKFIKFPNLDVLDYMESLVPMLKLASVPWLRKELERLSWPTEVVGRQQVSTKRWTLFNTFEALNLLRSSICNEQVDVGRLQTGVLINSLLESQLTALGARGPIGSGFSSSKPDLRDKSIVFYSGQDEIIGTLLAHFGIKSQIQNGTSYAEKFADFPQDGSQLDALLAGLKPTQPGSTLAFELWKPKVEPITTRNVQNNTFMNEEFAFVRLLIYQRDDGTYENVQFERVKLGTICRQAISQKYGQLSGQLLDYLYKNAPTSIDQEIDCPFHLWRNITSDQSLTSDSYEQLCHH